MKSFIRKKLREGYDDVSIDYIKNKVSKLDNYLNYKQKDLGDFVLVADMYDEEKAKNYGLLGQILAFDKNDKTEIGSATFGFDYKNGPLKGAIDVRPDFRRKKVATQMYVFIEELTGLKIQPEAKHSDSAEKFWNQPNRPFGNIQEQMIDGINMNKGMETLCNKMTVNSYQEALQHVQRALEGIEEGKKSQLMQRIYTPLENLRHAQDSINSEIKHDGMSGDSIPDEADTYWHQIQTVLCGDGPHFQ
jgi:hypothetical protein